jgi:hypothetical protein
MNYRAAVRIEQPVGLTHAHRDAAKFKVEHVYIELRRGRDVGGADIDVIDAMDGHFRAPRLQVIWL